MYSISNKDFEDIIKYIDAYRQNVDLSAVDRYTYNQVRMAGCLIRRLKRKQPIEPHKTSSVPEVIIIQSDRKTR